MTDFYNENLDETYNTRDNFTCEYCRKINTMNVKINLKRKKKPRMVFVDDNTWFKFKGGAADFGTMSNFLNFLLGLYDRQKIEMNMVNSPESLEEVDE